MKRPPTVTIITGNTFVLAPHARRSRRPPTRVPWGQIITTIGTIVVAVIHLWKR